MPTMPPFVSTSSTRNLRESPKAWPLSQGFCGHGTLIIVVRMALMVMSVMNAHSPCLSVSASRQQASKGMLRKGLSGVNVYHDHEAIRSSPSHRKVDLKMPGAKHA